MKKIGKIMLFFSSYFPLFFILLLSELKNYLNLYAKVPYNFVHQTTTVNTTVNSCVFNSTKSITIDFICIYSLLVILSIYSLYAFKANYEFGSINTKKKIIVKSVSNGSQEAVSYLITIVAPLMGKYSAFSVFPDDLIGFTSTIVIFISIYIIYVNSNLIVVNPMLFFIGYSINKINFSYETNSKVEFEGVLLSKRDLDLTLIPPETILSEIDTNTFIFRRV